MVIGIVFVPLFEIACLIGIAATIEARTPTQDELARFFRRDSNGTWRVATVNEYKDASWAQFGESLPGEMQDAMGAIKLVMNFHYGSMALVSGGLILVEGGFTVTTVVAAGHEFWAAGSMALSTTNDVDYPLTPGGAVAKYCFDAAPGYVEAIDFVSSFGANAILGTGGRQPKGSPRTGRTLQGGFTLPGGGPNGANYSNAAGILAEVIDVARSPKFVQRARALGFTDELVSALPSRVRRYGKMVGEIPSGGWADDVRFLVGRRSLLSSRTQRIRHELIHVLDDMADPGLFSRSATQSFGFKGFFDVELRAYRGMYGLYNPVNVPLAGFNASFQAYPISSRVVFFGGLAVEGYWIYNNL